MDFFFNSVRVCISLFFFSCVLLNNYNNAFYFMCNLRPISDIILQWKQAYTSMGKRKNVSRGEPRKGNISFLINYERGQISGYNNDWIVVFTFFFLSYYFLTVVFFYYFLSLSRALLKWNFIQAANTKADKCAENNNSNTYFMVSVRYANKH